MKPKPAVPIDRANLKILSALQKNGKISFQKLSEVVGLSPSPCFFRVRNLEKAGVIRCYGAQIDLVKFGPHVMVMTEITLEKHTAEYEKQFVKYISGVPEIVSAYMVSGRFDYLLHFVCSGINRYMSLTEELSDANVGISHMSSYIILATTKPFEGYPLAQLAAGDG